MTTTYCTKADIDAIWSPSELIGTVDDDSSGTISSVEEAIISRAIERAAGRMNAYLEQRFVVASLAGNAWCRDCNAAIAAYLLSIRKSDEPPAPLAEQHDSYLRDLLEIAAGRLRLPDALPPAETMPTVTNFRIDLASQRRVKPDLSNSTGSNPAASLHRRRSDS